MSMELSMDPIVIDPPSFDQKAAWNECRAYVDECGGLERKDGETNWRAAFGADPGCCSCPACHQMYWAWGSRQRCAKCGFEYEVRAWAMYSWGVQAAWRGDPMYPQYSASKYYQYGYENPPPRESTPNLHSYYESLDWRSLMV